MNPYSSVQISPPANWQDFERHSTVLFKCILRDPNTQRNGRGGQKQHGVDIYGRRGGLEGHWVGIQCKGKDINYGGPVTAQELREELQKAKTFEPPLQEFFLITTAADDAKIQAEARRLTDACCANGESIRSVVVWGWDTLQHEISQHHEAIRAFHPDPFPSFERYLNEIKSISQEKGVSLDALKIILKKMGEAINLDNTSKEEIINIFMKKADDYSKIQESLKEINGETEEIRNLIKSAQECLEAGSFDCADDFIKQAYSLEEIGIQKAQENLLQRKLNAALLMADRGKLALLKFDYLQAFQHFGEAFRKLPEEVYNLKFIFKREQAICLMSHGENVNTQSLRQAIQVYSELTDMCWRPYDWASIQNDMGVAYRLIAQRAGNEWYFEKSIVCFRNALTVWEPDLEKNIAIAQHNLGVSLCDLGEKRRDKNILSDAIKSFNIALNCPSRSKDIAPKEWSMTQDSLGIAFKNLALIDHEEGDEFSRVFNSAQCVV